jgi:hypothetical protein
MAAGFGGAAFLEAGVDGFLAAFFLAAFFAAGRLAAAFFPFPAAGLVFFERVFGADVLAVRLLAARFDLAAGLAAFLTAFFLAFATPNSFIAQTRLVGIDTGRNARSLRSDRLETGSRFLV